MQQFKIEYRKPKKGETYVDPSSLDPSRPAFTTATRSDETGPARDVIVWATPAWPDKPVIVIEKGVRAGETLNKEIIAVREAGTIDYRDEYGNVWIANADTILKHHPYVPDGYVPLPESPSNDYQAGMRDGLAAAQERREYTADDLDSLPEDACAWDEDGDVWQRGAVSWFVAGGCGTFTNPLREGFRGHFYSAPEPGKAA